MKKLIQKAKERISEKEFKLLLAFVDCFGKEAEIYFANDRIMNKSKVVLLAWDAETQDEQKIFFHCEKYCPSKAEKKVSEFENRIDDVFSKIKNKPKEKENEK